jgi:hypothetical protein
MFEYIFSAILIGTYGLDDPFVFWLWFVLYSLLITGIFSLLGFFAGMPKSGGVIYIIFITFFLNNLAEFSNKTALRHEAWLGERAPSGIKDVTYDIENNQSQQLTCIKNNKYPKKEFTDLEMRELLNTNSNSVYVIKSKLEQPKWYQNNVQTIKPVNITIYKLGSWDSKGKYKLSDHVSSETYQNSFYYYDSILNSSGKTNFLLHRGDVSYNSAGESLDLKNKSFNLSCSLKDSLKIEGSNVHFCEALVDDVYHQCHLSDFQLKDNYFADTNKENFILFRNWNLDRSQQYHWSDQNPLSKATESENIEHRHRTEEHIKKLENNFYYHYSLAKEQ